VSAFHRADTVPDLRPCPGVPSKFGVNNAMAVCAKALQVGQFGAASVTHKSNPFSIVMHLDARLPDLRTESRNGIEATFLAVKPAISSNELALLLAGQARSTLPPEMLY
jgi:hypothetical protein